MATSNLAAILEQVQTGHISIRDAARRLDWLETGRATTCADCRFFRASACHLPSRPARPEHPDSTRCGSFEDKPDERDLAMPVQVYSDRMR